MAKDSGTIPSSGGSVSRRELPDTEHEPDPQAHPEPERRWHDGPEFPRSPVDRWPSSEPEQTGQAAHPDDTTIPWNGHPIDNDRTVRPHQPAVGDGDEPDRRLHSTADDTVADWMLPSGWNPEKVLAEHRRAQEPRAQEPRAQEPRAQPVPEPRHHDEDRACEAPTPELSPEVELAAMPLDPSWQEPVSDPRAALRLARTRRRRRRTTLAIAFLCAVVFSGLVYYYYATTRDASPEGEGRRPVPGANDSSVPGAAAGETPKVPSGLVGQPLEEARVRLAELGLRVRVESVASASVPRSDVVGIRPAENAPVESGQAVVVVTSSGPTADGQATDGQVSTDPQAPDPAEEQATAPGDQQVPVSGE